MQKHSTVLSECAKKLRYTYILPTGFTVTFYVAALLIHGPPYQPLL
uniref:Uncharacterized protein n=1 Tax=Anguilla anguilla TaxID=7936 RepID=A0A0E9SXU3_ANGAN